MYDRILVPVDGSPTSNAGLEEAIQLSKLTHGRLRIVHAVEQLRYLTEVDGLSGGWTGDVAGVLLQGGKEIVAQAKARAEAAGVEVDTKLFDNFVERIADLIADEAKNWKADLIVLGTHGRRGVRRAMLGSDAEQILRTSSVPVLLVRCPESSS
ncbi:MAG: universal stress protein [Paucibacter sp.]|nr:universal stress protein [Roseateles sp.]